MKRQKFEEAKQMPPLRHKTCEPFDVMQSKVCEWLWQNVPEVRQFVFDSVKNSKAIKYDADDGVWYGVDF